jgi:uncharacterized protein involved in exopolysaccharide biosynthesis
MSPIAPDRGVGPVAPRSLAAARRSDGELSLAELLQLVHRRRRLLLGSILLAGLIGMGIVAAATSVY